VNYGYFGGVRVVLLCELRRIGYVYVRLSGLDFDIMRRLHVRQRMVFAFFAFRIESDYCGYGKDDFSARFFVGYGNVFLSG
jgi:hypothetical protein